MHPFNTPLALRINPSFQKLGLIGIPPLLTSILLAFLAVFSVLLKLVLLCIISVFTLYYIRLHMRNSLKKSVKMVYQNSNKNWFIGIENIKKEVLLSESSFVSQQLIILNFSDSNHNKYTALITRDSISVTEFRRLIVRLKMI